MSTRQLVLAEDRAVAVRLSVEEVRRIKEEIDAAIAAAEVAIETLRALGGPEPGDFGSELRVLMNQGAGYFRAASGKIAAAWRRMNSHQRGVGKAEGAEGDESDSGGRRRGAELRTSNVEHPTSKEGREA